MKCLIFLILGLISLNSADDASVRDFTKANNLFTPDVYKKISAVEGGNFLVSPFSAETVLAFANSGCRGETAEELRNALHLPEDKEKVESAVKSLIPKLTGNEFYTLHTANKVYVKENFEIKNEFKKAATEVFHADSESIDFVEKIEAAKTMNQWVEKHTENKIKNLIDSEDLNTRTRLVLLNALYFKANWSTPFFLHSTAKANFYKSATDVIKVETLHHFEEYFNYYECPHLKAHFLELPFQGGEASMVIVLPNEKEGLSSLEKYLDQVFTPPHTLKQEFLNVALPKFKIETTIDFKKVLNNLGVTQAFSDEKADLSGVAGVKGDLKIDKVTQKTFIDVNEEGVEAAAATLVYNIQPMSGPLETPKNFTADHPFIFYIKVKDLIIFAGRVTDPKY